MTTVRTKLFLSAISLPVVTLLQTRAAHAQFGGSGSLSGQIAAQQSYQQQFAQRPVQQQPAVAPPWGQSGPVQTMWLRPGGGGPDPVLHGALAVAAVPATTMGAGCRGAFPTAPQQQLWVGASVPMVDVLVRAGGPTTLAIRAPTGAVFCTDNLSGTDARITMRSVMAGTYLIYVGTTGAPVPYTIGASAQGPLNPAAIPLPPGAQQGAPWLPQNVTTNNSAAQGTTAPAVRAADGPSVSLSVGGAQASAQIATQTPVPVNTNSSAIAPAQVLPAVTVAAANSGATAGGVPVGWVHVDPNAPQAALRAPSDAVRGAPGRGNGTINVAPSGPDVQRANGTTPGRVALRFMGRACLGFGDRAPSLVFSVEPGVRFLRVFARSSGDTTLAVRAPNGRVTCVDDTYGAHPGVDLEQPAAGQWRVFVGSSVPNAALPYELTVTTRNDARPQ
ncbi:MAG: hypothetical protein U0269_37385 [Polyangiales bacterium]